MFQSVLSIAFFVGLYYVIMRESFILLLFIFFGGAFYSIGFLKSLQEKQRLLFIVPATTAELVQAIFLLVFRTLGALALLILPFYLLASFFDKVASPLFEMLILYVAVVGCVLLFSVVSTWLYFSLKERSYVTLLQFTALMLITLINFSIVMTFEKISLHIIWQLLILVVLYVSIIFYLYKRTITKIQNFNLH